MHLSYVVCFLQFDQNPGPSLHDCAPGLQGGGHELATKIQESCQNS